MFSLYLQSLLTDAPYLDGYKYSIEKKISRIDYFKQSFENKKSLLSMHLIVLSWKVLFCMFVALTFLDSLSSGFKRLKKYQFLFRQLALISSNKTIAAYLSNSNTFLDKIKNILEYGFVSRHINL